jgi:hypothetical protein
VLCTFVFLRLHLEQVRSLPQSTCPAKSAPPPQTATRPFTIGELLLTEDGFKKKFNSVTGLSLKPDAPHCKELTELGAKIVTHKPGRMKEMVEVLQQTGADTICLIPPSPPPHENKFDITVELIEAAKKASIPNVLFISSARCDLAGKEKQPRLREFVELEVLFMSANGDPSTPTGQSPVVIQ